MTFHTFQLNDPANDKLSCRAAPERPSRIKQRERPDPADPYAVNCSAMLAGRRIPNSSLPNSQIALLLNALSYAGSVPSGLAEGYAT